MSDTGGVILLRRLNKREYRHTINDLLGVEVDAKDLPNDGGGGTFDTFGKSLFISSDQIEQYSGGRASGARLGTSAKETVQPKTVREEVEEEVNRRVTYVLRNYYMKGYQAYREWKSSNGRLLPTSGWSMRERWSFASGNGTWLPRPSLITSVARNENRGFVVD